MNSFPVAFTDEPALQIRVLWDYRDQLISDRTRMINRLRWHLVTIEAQIGQAALKGPRICTRLSRQLARLPLSPQLRVARALLRRITEIGRVERELLAELTTLLDPHAPQLLAQRQYAAIYRAFAHWLREQLGRPPVVGDLDADVIAVYARPGRSEGSTAASRLPGRLED